VDRHPIPKTPFDCARRSCLARAGTPHVGFCSPGLLAHLSIFSATFS
jgi:hypothetical protein